MKKVILKTALITIAIAIILAISAFGIVSFCAPAVMMRLTDSLGMETVCGDYAYEEYSRSGDLKCLSRAFLIAEEKNENLKAEERFAALYAAEGFEGFCEGMEPIVVKNAQGEEIFRIGYRAYLCGRAACMKARLAETKAERAEAIDFAFSETAADFPSRNPVFALAVEIAPRADFSAELLERLEEDATFDKTAAAYSLTLELLQKNVGGNV